MLTGLAVKRVSCPCSSLRRNFPCGWADPQHKAAAGSPAHSHGRPAVPRSPAPKPGPACRSALQSTIPARLGCGLVYVTYELGNPRRVRLAPPPQRWGAAAAASAGPVSAAAGAFGTNQFSVLGQGYNCMVGLPISVGMSSLDPGFT